MTNERLTGAALVEAVRAECDRLEAMEAQATAGPWSGGIDYTGRLFSDEHGAHIANFHTGTWMRADVQLTATTRNTFRASLAAMRWVAEEYNWQFQDEYDVREVERLLNDWLEAVRRG